MHQSKQMGSQSMEMLKVRANLEEKLKKKGIYNLDRSQNHTAMTANRYASFIFPV